MRRLDHWLGKRLFVPAIIWICQRTGVSQYRFHNYGWMIAAWLILYAALLKNPTGAGFWVLFALWLTWRAGIHPDHEGHDAPFLRKLVIVLEAAHLFEHLTGVDIPMVGRDFDPSCPVGLIILAAEYARTITTIPPREIKRRFSKRAEAA